VRELENAVAHAVAVAEGGEIQLEDLPAAIRAPRLLPQGPAGAPEGVTPAGRNAEPPSRESWSLAEVEKEHIQRVLDRHQGNATAAAKQLGISRTTLWRKLREYGITRAMR
jgi:transcriptional regulator of acetoin/glycerol metabolism